MIRKKLHQTFKDKGLKIAVELCDDNVDFLDISVNVSEKSHRLYKKPKDTPLYINKMSNHPKSIINNIPDMVSKRLSNLSSDKRSFLDSKHAYVSALKHSGFAEELYYQEHTAPRKKTRRKRNVKWFNLPFSSNVETKIGKKFFNILDK